MKFSIKRVAALAVASAVILGGLVVAQAANADAISGTITLHGPKLNVTTIGAPITSGNLSDAPAFYGITVDQGCPVGFRGRSDTLAFQGGVKLGSLATSRNSSVTAYGNTGLDGNPIAMDDTYSVPNTNAYVNNTAFGSIANALVTGAWEIRLYCSALSTSINLVTDKYFVLPMTADTTAGTWSVYVAPPVKTNTTVSLTGAAQGDHSVILTGTVKDPSLATATGAIGSIKFFDNTSALIGSGAVASGVGSFQTAILPVGSYTFTAQFIGASDPAYNDSPVSAIVTVVISSNVAPINITVSIPSGVGSLTLTGVASSVNLGTAVLNSGVLTASGTLPAVTVTDTRQLDAAAWSLTGITTNFTAGAKVLDGKYLGWAPFTADAATNAGTIGATVAPAPGSANGIKSVATLASGLPVDQKPTTKVGAVLNLAAPATTPSGSYSATLTLTLV